MKFAEALPGVLVLVLRLSFVPPSRWGLDWIAALAVLWIAVTLTKEDSRMRRGSVAAACVWLAVIYALHQGPQILAGWS